MHLYLHTNCDLASLTNITYNSDTHYFKIDEMFCYEIIKHDFAVLIVPAYFLSLILFCSVIAFFEQHEI